MSTEKQTFDEKRLAEQRERDARARSDAVIPATTRRVADPAKPDEGLAERNARDRKKAAADDQPDDPGENVGEGHEPNPEIASITKELARMEQKLAAQAVPVDQQHMSNLRTKLLRLREQDAARIREQDGTKAHGT